MKVLRLLLAAAAAVLAAPALAGDKTVALSVPGMYCEMCPLTVKKALSKVPGVSQVNVSYEKKEAFVIFDDAKTSVNALTKATADAGYPSTPKQ